jgi:hypothetical protein
MQATASYRDLCLRKLICLPNSTCARRQEEDEYDDEPLPIEN